MATRAKASSGGNGKRRPARKRPLKKVAARSQGLGPAQVAEPTLEGEALARRIAEDGGVALAVYRDPLGGHPVVLASLPVDKVEATPYQRDLSEPHVKRLARAMQQVGRFLDPLIAVRHDGRYWSPNGNHRLAAARLLGAQAVVGLVLPDEEVAFRILALNTEKAHNLKERSLEVIRMYRGMVGARTGQEADQADLFEEPAFITLGAAYERRPRFSGGAYHPLLKRMDHFLELPLEDALAVREARAGRLLELDDEVIRIVAGLKERGLTSPYLKNFVVARLNFLRFKKEGDVEFDPSLEKMLRAAERFDLGRVKREDLARMGGGPAEGEAAEA